MPVRVAIHSCLLNRRHIVCLFAIVTKIGFASSHFCKNLCMKQLEFTKNGRLDKGAAAN